MSDKPYTIVVDGSGNVSERKLGDHDPGTVIDQSVRYQSHFTYQNVNVLLQCDFQ